METPDTTLEYSEARIPDPALRAKYRLLTERLAALGGAVIGFSGGVDSTLLAAVARQVLGRDRTLACLAVSPSLARRDHQEALELAARERGFSVLLYGANADDGSDYRPGHKAAREHGGLAPLAEAGLTKAEVRSLSRAFGLPTADKPAAPCLSSRIPYGTAVTPSRLSAVENGESLLRAMGFRECRLRHEGDTARLEVPLDQMGLFSAPEAAQKLVDALKRLRFKKVVVDLEGFRSGSLNAALSDEDRQRFAHSFQ